MAAGSTETIPSGVPTGQLVRTPHFVQTLAAFKHVRGKSAIAIDGDPGLGKTFSARYACSTLDVEVYECNMTGATTPLVMFQTLFRSISGRWPERMTRAMLEHECQELLADRPCALMIDEAQWADQRLLRCARSIYDNASDEFQLILVGHDVIRRLIAAESSLHSRLARTIVFERLKPAKLVLALHEFHPLFAGTDSAVIAELDAWARGNFRNWERILEVALSYDLGSGGGLTRSEVKLVLQTITGRPDGGRAR